MKLSRLYTHMERSDKDVSLQFISKDDDLSADYLPRYRVTPGRVSERKRGERSAVAQPMVQKALFDFGLNFGNFFIVFSLILASINRLPNLTRPGH